MRRTVFNLLAVGVACALPSVLSAAVFLTDDSAVIAGYGTGPQTTSVNSSSTSPQVAARSDEKLQARS